MGPFDDDSYLAGQRDALMGEHPDHDNIGYMAGWFAGMEEAEREINGEDEDFDDDEDDDFDEDLDDDESNDLFDEDEDSGEEDW